MRRFIKLTASTGFESFVAVDAVNSIISAPAADGQTHLDLSNGKYMRVKETAEEILQLIEVKRMTNEPKQIMMDGHPLKVGDPVFCLLRGNGVLDEILEKSPNFPLTTEGFTVQFGEHAFRYSNTGCPLLGGVFQPTRTLYWQKPEITPPAKPNVKRMVKVWDWFVQWPNGSVTRKNEVSEIGILNIGTIKKIQKIDGTERKIEVD